jgi:pyruvate-formate lyase-activating enzyme
MGGRMGLIRVQTVAMVVTGVLKDRLCYKGFWGCITFSGGEPLALPPFQKQMLDVCRARDAILSWL